MISLSFALSRRVSYEYSVTFLFQVNFSRHYSNVANMVVEMCEGLIVSLSLHKVGSDCICDLVTMKNAHLPDLSSEQLILSYHRQ